MSSDFEKQHLNDDSFIEEVDLNNYNAKSEKQKDFSYGALYAIQEGLNTAYDNRKNRRNRDDYGKSMKVGMMLGAVVASVIFVLGTLLVNSVIPAIKIEQQKRAMASIDPMALPDDVFLRKIESIKKIIDSQYIFDYKQSDIQDGILKGMISALNDPYSRYFTKREYDQTNDVLSASYSGIGIAVTKGKREKGLTITHIYDHSPAKKAGLKQGDKIVEIDGKPISASATSTEAIRNIKGEIGTSVELKIITKKGGKVKKVSLERAKIYLPTVISKMLKGTLGYIHIAEFAEKTEEEFRDAYFELEDKGVKKLVIDLRENHGGYLKVVTKMLDDFLKDGIIIYTEDKQGNKRYVEADSNVEYDMPIVVLVNGESASAAEIFAGTVQDRGLGKLVGETTYGKGVVQDSFKFDDGSALMLTTSKYYTESGREIHGRGIEPDVKIIYREPKANNKKYTYKDDNQLMRAIQIIEGKK